MTRAKHPHPLALAAISVACLLTANAAQASIFEGETLDAVANGTSWVVLVLVPIIGISVFWLVQEAIALHASQVLRGVGEVENALAALQYDQQAYRIGRQDLRGVQQQQQQVQSARMALLRVQSEQLIQRVNLHLALGGSFGEPVTVAAITPK